MNCKKRLTTLLIFLFVALLALPALAEPYRRGQREQADSKYRQAEKAYKRAHSDYGPKFDGMSAEQKASVCKDIHLGLYYNRRSLISEDFFRQRVVKGQIQKLEQYQSDLGCPAK